MPKRRANGEGNIRKRKDGRWEGRYTVGHDPETGKAIIKNVLGKTQAEVKEKLKKAIEENVGIDYGRAKTYTVGTWLEVWMENYAKVKLRPSTFKTSQGFLKNHIKPQIGSVPLAELTSLDLQRFYKHLLDGGRVDRIEAKKKPKGLAPKTVRSIHQMICSAYNLAIEQCLVTKNPTQGCALPKVEHKEMKTLTADQLSTFFREARDSGVYELYYLDLATGLRRGELLGLKWADVDLDRGVLKIQRAISRQNGKVVEVPLKTKNAYRTLPLSADAIDVLKAQKNKVGSSEWVFPSPTGGPMSPDSVLHMLQRVLKRAGLPRIRFHDLRHPYVKHTTKIFSLRLMDFQAQAYPDARRKTRGACQLLRVGQSRSPVRPLCNRKRFSCLPPQSKMSWILYAISMRLSGYTSTRSISSSASSVVSVSASKIALDAFLRLSCRACSSCFFFACANTAA
jgi:integrase